jgi:DNA-directed RNA polymerase alpha subunit
MKTLNDTQIEKEIENKFENEVTTQTCSVDLNKQINNENETPMEIDQNNELKMDNTVKKDIEEPQIEFVSKNRKS